MRRFRLAVTVATMPGLGAVLPTQAHAQAAMQGETDSSTVYRFPTPPPGFAPSTASDAERAQYGLPPMPNPFAGGRAAYTSWARAMQAARHYVVPEFRQETHRHGAMIGGVQIGPKTTSPAAIQPGATTSTNWSGRAVVGSASGYGASSFVETMGQWLVPAVQQSVGVCSGVEVSAEWIGIDGLVSRDVAQAGTESDATCAAGNTTQTDYVWFEWYPANGFEITNFPVSPGVAYFVVVQATSATHATVVFVNLQNGNYTTTGFTAPAGTSLIGNSAEWILERPGTGNTLGVLADFGQAPMASEIAYTASQLGTSSLTVPGAPLPGQTADLLTMLNAAGTTIATVAPLGISGQLVQATGPTQ